MSLMVQNGTKDGALNGTILDPGQILCDVVNSGAEVSSIIVYI